MHGNRQFVPAGADNKNASADASNSNQVVKTAQDVHTACQLVSTSGCVASKLVRA